MSALNVTLEHRLQPLRIWYAGLQPREKVMVRWGAIALPVIILASIVLMMHTRVSTLDARVEKKHEDLAWMRMVSGELRAAGPAVAGAADGAAGSLRELVVQSSQQTGLGTALTGSQNNDKGGLRVTMENAPFDALVSWLALLERQHSVTIEQVEVNRTAKPGVVTAAVVLRKPG